MKLCLEWTKLDPFWLKQAPRKAAAYAAARSAAASKRLDAIRDAERRQLQNGGWGQGGDP